MRNHAGNKLWLLTLVLLLSRSVMAADPTQPPGWLADRAAAQKPVSADQYQLQQVLIRTGAHSAIINGQLVKAGDKIKGAKVLKIQRDRVVLRAAKKNLTLSLVNNTGAKISRVTSGK